MSEMTDKLEPIVLKALAFEGDLAQAKSNLEKGLTEAGFTDFIVGDITIDKENIGHGTIYFKGEEPNTVKSYEFDVFAVRVEDLENE